KARNTYQALPAILSQRQGYTSAVLHGDGKSFWNRDEIYKQFAIDEFFDETYYDMSEEQVINYGLKDKTFFEESMTLLESLDKSVDKNKCILAHILTGMENHF